uniref:Uncharacterized protein n=1 Tax=Arundo donax TaxID=35708 RepID=A0A0A9B6I3_ARUDO
MSLLPILNYFSDKLVTSFSTSVIQLHCSGLGSNPV